LCCCFVYTPLIVTVLSDHSYPNHVGLLFYSRISAICLW